MAYIRLSTTDAWQLADNTLDPRGWNVRNAENRDLGTLVDMTVDTEQGQVQTLVLDTGAEYAAHQAMVGDEVIYADVSPQLDGNRTNTYRPVHLEIEVRHLNDGPISTFSSIQPETFMKDFKTHFDENYAKTGARYEDYEPAYRIGYDQAQDLRTQDNTFESVEDQFRSLFETRHPGRAYDSYAGAIRHGFNVYQNSLG